LQLQFAKMANIEQSLWLTERTKEKTKEPAPRMAKPLQACSKCEKNQDLNNGVQLTPTKWICGACWAQRLRKMK
jgi:hypothetical protein